MVTGWSHYKYCRRLIASRRRDSLEVTLLQRWSEILYLYLSLFRIRVELTVTCAASSATQRAEWAERFWTELILGTGLLCSFLHYFWRTFSPISSSFVCIVRPVVLGVIIVWHCPHDIKLNQGFMDCATLRVRIVFHCASRKVRNKTVTSSNIIGRDSQVSPVSPFQDVSR